MNDLAWNDLGFESLREYGAKSVSVEYPYPCDGITAINGDEFGVLRIPSYNIEFNVDGAGLNRLQEALKGKTRTPEEEIKHELKIMHDVNDCDGMSVSEKIDDYFEKTCEMANKAPEGFFYGHYKIKHR